MTTMLAPDRGAIQTDVGATRYHGTRFDAAPGHVKWLREAGYVEATVTGSTARKAVGFRCDDCGFGTFFTTCSRCGGEGVRE